MGTENKIYENRYKIAFVVLLIIVILLIISVISTTKERNTAKESIAEVEVESTEVESTEAESLDLGSGELIKTTNEAGEEVYVDSSGNIISTVDNISESQADESSKFNNLGNLFQTKEDESKPFIFGNETQVGNEIAITETESEAVRVVENNNSTESSESSSEIIDYDRYIESSKKGIVTEHTDTQSDFGLDSFRMDVDDDMYDYTKIGIDRENGVYDCEVGIYRDGLIVGTKADEWLQGINSVNRVKYKISCEDGLENLVIPYKIKYTKDMNSENEKLEPQMFIGYKLKDYIDFKGTKLIPKITILYTVKNVSYREGYIITKVPVDRYTEFTIKIKGYDEDAGGEIEL